MDKAHKASNRLYHGLGAGLLIAFSGLALWLSVSRWPWFQTHELWVEFQWDRKGGFTSLRVLDEAKGWRASVADYLISIQVEPRIAHELKKEGWQRASGSVAVTLEKGGPIAVLSGWGSDGAIVNDPDVTPLMQAAASGDIASINRLIASGCDVNARDQRRFTALIHTCMSRRGSAEIVQALISAGADPNATDRSGNSALLLAVIRGNPEIVSALLAAHADPNTRNNEGDTPLSLAEHMGWSEIVRLLMRAGAQP